MSFYKDVKKPVFGEYRFVEFGSEDGAYTRTPVSVAGIRSAMRTDINTYKSFGSDDLRKQIYELMSISNNPSLLYDFEKMIDLFAQEIVPSQIVFRYEGDLIYFSPSRVTLFGPN